MLKAFDLIIVSGGGQIDDYWGGPMGHPYTLIKWAVLAKLTGVKFVFLSVGVCNLESALSRIFVKYALKLSDYRSYRDNGSKRLLFNYRFTKDDNIAPDLAFSYDSSILKKANSKDFRREVLRIGISPIVYLCKSYWPKNDDIIFENYIRKLNEFTMQLMKSGYEIVLFSSDRADADVVEKFMNLENFKASNRKGGRLQTVKTEYVKELLEEISHLDCVVASRLHGVILAHLCSVPVLAISYDRKVTEHMKDMGQMNFCLDIHRFEMQELEKMFELLVCDRHAIRKKIAKKVETFNKKLGMQYDFLVRNTLKN